MRLRRLVIIGLTLGLMVIAVVPVASAAFGLCHATGGGSYTFHPGLSTDSPGHSGHSGDFNASSAAACGGDDGGDTGDTDTGSAGDHGRTPFVPPGGWDEVAPCLVSGCSTDPQSLGSTVGQLFGGADTLVMFVSMIPADDVDLDCAGFLAQSDVVAFDVWGTMGASPNKWIAVTLLGAGDYGMDACYGGEDGFTEADGSDASFDGTFWVGVLPDCDETSGPGPAYGPGDGPDPEGPCVESRTLDPATGDVTLLIYAPPGDPLVKIG